MHAPVHPRTLQLSKGHTCDHSALLCGNWRLSYCLAYTHSELETYCSQLSWETGWLLRLHTVTY